MSNQWQYPKQMTFRMAQRVWDEINEVYKVASARNPVTTRAETVRYLIKLGLGEERKCKV